MSPRPRILLVAATTGYQTRIFVEAVRRLEYDLVLATDRCHVLEDPWGDRAIPVRFETGPDSARQVLKGGPFDGVVAVGDRPAVLAAEVAALAGIPFHTTVAARAAHDKFYARRVLESAGLPVPAYFRVSLDEDPRDAAARAAYPCVLKPVGLSASRGVIRADDRGAFVAAFGRIRAMLERAPDIAVLRDEQNRYLQVESYIEGREFAVEALATAGELRVLAIFDKPDPLEGPFFEETIYVTPSREDPATQEAIRDAVDRAAGALGLDHGPIHAELRVNRSGAWILEAAARPIGGLCAQALRFGDGMPLEELILRHAAGEDVRSLEVAGPASGVMMIPIPRAGIYERAEGIERARAVPGIDDVIITAKQGQMLVPLPEGSSYLGFLFARGKLPGAVEQALRRAHGELRFQIATALDTLRP